MDVSGFAAATWQNPAWQNPAWRNSAGGERLNEKRLAEIQVPCVAGQLYLIYNVGVVVTIPPE